MSKTWKTRPLMVRMADKRDTGAGIQESHDHTQGSCDLPGSPEEQMSQTGTTCRYYFKYTGHKICSCNLCSDKFERRKSIKQTRQNKRSTIKEQLD